MIKKIGVAAALVGLLAFTGGALAFHGDNSQKNGARTVCPSGKRGEKCRAWKGSSSHYYHHHDRHGRHGLSLD